MYPGLTNTRVELRKIVRSSCFMILRIHFITTRKIQEIAFQGFQISKFSRGNMPSDPPRWLAPSARDCPPQLQCPGAATVWSGGACVGPKTRPKLTSLLRYLSITDGCSLAEGQLNAADFNLHRCGWKPR